MSDFYGTAPEGQRVEFHDDVEERTERVGYLTAAHTFGSHYDQADGLDVEHPAGTQVRWKPSERAGQVWIASPEGRESLVPASAISTVPPSSARVYGTYGTEQEAREVAERLCDEGRRAIAQSVRFMALCGDPLTPRTTTDPWCVLSTSAADAAEPRVEGRSPGDRALARAAELRDVLAAGETLTEEEEHMVALAALAEQQQEIARKRLLDFLAARERAEGLERLRRVETAARAVAENPWGLREHRALDAALSGEDTPDETRETP